LARFRAFLVGEIVGSEGTPMLAIQSLCGRGLADADLVARRINAAGNDSASTFAKGVGTEHLCFSAC